MSANVRLFRTTQRPWICSTELSEIAGDRLRVLQRPGRADPLPSADVDGPVARNGEQPGAKLLGWAALVQPLQRREKCVMGDVLGVSRVAEHRQSCTVHSAQVPIDQNTKGLAMAVAGGAHQDGIVERRRRLSHGAAEPDDGRARRSGGLHVLQRNVEVRGVTRAVLGDRQQQLRTALVVNPVVRVPRVSLTLDRVWLLRVDLVGERVVEKQL